MSSSRLFAIVFIAGLLTLAGCEDRKYQEYDIMVPVYMSWEELRESVALVPSAELSRPGKIYLHKGLIFVNEYMKGIHIIDNSNPAAPAAAGFINVPGNIDMSVKGRYLFVDSYTDLVVLDIDDLENIREAGRLKDVFPYSIPETEEPGLPADQVYTAKGVVTGWEMERRRERVTSQHWYPSPGWFGSKLYYTGYMQLSGGTGGWQGTGTAAGKGGSMARFGIFDNYLYGIEDRKINVFNIADPAMPVKLTSHGVNSVIETIFILGDKMFIGGRSSMFIYDLAEPASPEYVSEYTHITACDPVVVEDDIAYVTLRGGTICGGGINRLDIIDVSDLKQPELIAFHWLDEPYGLGIDNGILFLCEGENGMTVYDAANPYAIKSNIIKEFPGIHAWDVIPAGGILLLIGDDGLYQYDYSDVSDIRLVSQIPVNQQGPASTVDLP
ncbi:MAG: hypothetical protein EA408_02760 [Marinilabiliales bacterium]|nr:MAG: hypothetical protein EA408_02760 [Marinilabiliales bacterium]